MRPKKPLLALSLDDTDPFAPSAEQPLRTRLRALPQDTHFEPHTHAWAQLACCGSGLLQVSVRATGAQGGEHDTSVILPPQRAVWIPPRAMHSVMVVEAAHSRTVYVDASVAPAGWQQVRVLAVSPLLQAMIDALDQPLYRDQPLARQAMTTLMLHELAHATPLPLGVPMPSVQHGDRRLRALCEAVLNEPAACGSLAEWAAQMGASERTMARLFRTQLGTSFHRWRQQAVLARALPRLAQRVPVGEVAAESGYASESAFSAMFKSAMGASPRHFRPTAPAVTPLALGGENRQAQ
ncbi:AraC family transcriptional regulator [Hydrogenophaga sp. OTU3427]|uniref:AraC family transcriptional regulator n=1 Tax=Hydrogenophaga sp. OTU3427 TaxID=3043856 RepID=UPI00313EFA08